MLKSKILSETLGGLNQYDFEARTQLPQSGMFSTPDSKAGNYPWLNPYLYCAANPIRYIDHTGMDIWNINEEGKVVYFLKTKDKFDTFNFVDNKGNTIKDSKGNEQSIIFDKGTVIRHSQRHYAPFERGNGEKIPAGKADIIEIRGDDNATQLFEMFAQNVTAVSKNEVSLIRTGNEGKEGHNFISSGHVQGSEPGMSHLYYTQLYNKYTLREMIHTHPKSEKPSDSDNNFKEQISNNQISNRLKVPVFKIYNTITRKFIPF